MICSSCQQTSAKHKAKLECSLCQAAICKSCAHIIDPVDFAFAASFTTTLAGGTYCPACFDSQIQPSVTLYEQTATAARDVAVFFKTQSKETRLLSRLEKPLTIDHCADRDEAIMHLAFLATRAGFNGLIDVDVSSRKVRNEAYQTLVWKASGVPCEVSEAKLIKDRSFRTDPN